MLSHHLQSRFIAFAAGLALLFAVSWAHADPSARVARLGYIDGTVSFSPAGDTDWVQAALNRPLTTGDRLWADTNSRAELQIGGAAIRLGASTNVMIINLDDRMAQIQLSQGSLKVRVRQMGRNQSFEVDTPNLSFSISQPGDYRIDVDPSGDATLVAVQLGQAQVYGEDASYVVKAGQGFRFYGTNLSDYDTVSAELNDDLDRWSHERDRRTANSDAARYVSYDVVGYEDLDAYGSWRSDPSYGNVWRPRQLPSGWTPYRDGHWAWIDPWGWNWVDDAPWGYAVSHYGRWAHVGGSWGWIPGPQREQAVYAPALVVFLGGKNFQGSVSVGDGGGAVGWFPLAPREIYQPAYQVSRGYFDRVNRSNAVIPSTTISNVYNVYNTNVTKTNNTVVNVTQVAYVNRRIPGAVVAAPVRAFMQSQSVSKLAVAVSKDAANRADVTHVAAIVPTAQSVHGGAPDARSKPPTHERRIVARTAPPAPAPTFAAQQSQLAEKPGTPIDDQQRKQIESKTPSDSIRHTTVVPVAKAATPVAVPPAVAPKARSPSERKADAAKAQPAVSGPSKPDAVKVLPTTTDSARTTASQIPAAKTEADKANAARADAIKTENATATGAKAEADKADQAKASAARADALKAENARAVAAKAEGEKNNAIKVNQARDDAAKAESIRAAGAKAEADKANEAKASAARADALKAENARAAATKAEGEKNNAIKANQARDDAAKAESIRAAGAKAEADKANAAKASAARADALKAENARAAAAKAEGEKNNASKANKAREDAAKAESIRAAGAKVETDKANAARATAARADAIKAENARAAAAKAAGEKANSAKPEATKGVAPPKTPRPPASEPG